MSLFFFFLDFCQLHRFLHQNTRIGYFTLMSKCHLLFGYFTQFVNSVNSHLCTFAFLPPTHLNIDMVLFGSCSHVIMMMPKVDPRAEQGARMWNRDRLRNRMSRVKNSNDIRFKYFWLLSLLVCVRHVLGPVRNKRFSLWLMSTASLFRAGNSGLRLDRKS